MIIYALIATFIWTRYFSVSDIELNSPITIEKWENFSKIYDSLGRLESNGLKLYIRKNKDDLKPVQPGTYIFSGSYTPWELVDLFNDWPEVSYSSVTILEWWSIYDVDDALVSKNLIEKWEYISFARDQDIISAYTKRYDFVQQAVSDNWWELKTLEWMLYPDTYYIDTDKDVIDQLVFLQLDTFNKKVWSEYGTPLSNMDARLQKLGYDVSLTFYGALRLASIIEKEERVDENKPLIAGIFMNRLNDGMRLDADISLCYGLRTWYELCTPQVIWENIRDETNPYNTRAVSGLPPTPISSVQINSIKALIDIEKTDNYYYLHDDTWQIHPGKDLSEHNINKSTYIN